MDKLPVGQLPDLASSNNDDEIMVITNSEYNQLKKEKISDLITDFTSTDENNALTKGTDGKMFVTDFGNASNITEGTLPVSVLPDIPKDKLPPIETADLPVSGVTADTYAYPSSVTVNAQGQVTAIEAGEPGANNANQDLSNLSEAGESHFANPDLSNITDAGKEVIRENSGGGLEICDIGMALYIDETKGLRRRLNGTILDINTNTQAFLTRLQQITTLYPSLVCTEEEWQAAKTLSAFGQVGKFVYNYGSDGTTVVSVRLPAVVNIQGLQDLQNTGLTVEQNMQGLNIAAGSTTTVAGLPVQEEAIQYPYFIQIATGAETENNIINDIELNNPFSLFDSKYSDHELNNLSWLKSEGQWNAKAVYPTAYDKLLKVYNGTETVEGLSVKLSTEEYTDYDFVLNTADETFRLPLLDGSENVPDFGASPTLITQNWVQGTQYTAPKNGHFQVATSATGAGQYTDYVVDSSYTFNSGSSANGTNVDMIPVSRGSVLTMSTTFGGSKGTIYFYPNTGNGSLYYYVGETVQNANLIDAGRIGEVLADKVDMLQASGAGMPSNKYIDLTLGASGSTYTAPANGYIHLGCQAQGGIGWFNLSASPGVSLNIPYATSGGGLAGFIPIRKGQKFVVTYSRIGNILFRFYYTEGEKND